MELSIIVATYEMQREAPRTIRTLLPPLQQDVEDFDYEIIIVDNGSPNGPPDFSGVDFAGVEHRVRAIAPDIASPSPAAAINAAIDDAVQSDFVMICIDGARMVSKCAVARSLAILRRLPDAVTFLQSRHLGHNVQMAAVENGYCQSEEDQLLSTVAWERDADHLFDISVLAGCHDRSQPLLQNESNAITMARSTWEELGGFNAEFQSAGGGLVNLELFNRIVSRSAGPAILIAGEATFHQFHGGAATSARHYFAENKEEYRRITGLDYCRPDADYLIDFNTNTSRLKRSGVEC